MGVADALVMGVADALVIGVVDVRLTRPGRKIFGDGHRSKQKVVSRPPLLSYDKHLSYDNNTF